MKTNTRNAIIVLAIIAAGLWTGVIQALFAPFLPYDPTGENTTTDTTTTTTTTTSPVQFTFKAMWDFVPIMQVDPPGWIRVELSSSTGVYRDAAELTSENTWFTSINALTISFEQGVDYRLSVVASSGWEFQVDFHDYALVTPGYTGHDFDLTVGDWQDWGNLFLEWIAK